MSFALFNDDMGWEWLFKKSGSEYTMPDVKAAGVIFNKELIPSIIDALTNIITELKGLNVSTISIS